MPGHANKKLRLPKRKPTRLPRDTMMGDAPTRGMNPKEIQAALDAGEITQREAVAMMRNLQRMSEANRPPAKRMQKGGLTAKEKKLDMDKSGDITQKDILMGRGVLPMTAAFGGMTKKSRVSQTDYRDKGMFYVGGMAAKITPINKGKKG